MSTAKEIIDSASGFVSTLPCVLMYKFTFRPMPVDIVHNEREMIQKLNQIISELESDNDIPGEK
jgi:hypothetical protein